MRTITHRELRNQSGEVLRRVAGGESIEVTNHGVVAALIVPPSTDVLSELAARGQVRVARRPLSDLRLIQRGTVARDSAAIIADVRGRW